MTDLPTLVPVVALALVDDAGRVLMQRRPLNKAHGGLWEYPGGKIEPGESAESALVREIAEELALTIRAEDLQPLAFASGGALPDSDSAHIVILLYTCERWTGEAQNLDAQEIGWFLPEELNSLPMPPLDVPLTKSFQQAQSWLAKPKSAAY